MKLFLSHSPATKSRLSGRWYKSVKNQKGIGGKIVVNAFGDTKEQAEENAAKIVELWNKDFAKNNHPVSS